MNAARTRAGARYLTLALSSALVWRALVHAQPAQHAEVVRRLPLIAHVAQHEGAAVADAAFVLERVQRANRVFAPYRVELVLERCLPLPAAAPARLETRADRDALARYRTPHVIDWFVVESLRDVDDPSQLRRGVHWHARTDASAHYVIVSTLGLPVVFAHELGHYLGNPEHSQTEGNLMSYSHGAGEPFLDAAQIVNMERALHHYAVSGELRPVRAGSARAAAGCQL